MSPTSYQLLYPAMWIAKIRKIFDSANFICKNFKNYDKTASKHYYFAILSM